MHNLAAQRLFSEKEKIEFFNKFNYNQLWWNASKCSVRRGKTRLKISHVSSDYFFFFCLGLKHSLLFMPCAWQPDVLLEADFQLSTKCRRTIFPLIFSLFTSTLKKRFAEIVISASSDFQCWHFPSLKRKRTKLSHCIRVLRAEQTLV